MSGQDVLLERLFPSIPKEFPVPPKILSANLCSERKSRTASDEAVSAILLLLRCGGCCVLKTIQSGACDANSGSSLMQSSQHPVDT